MAEPPMRYLRRLNEPAAMDRDNDPDRLRQLLRYSSCIFMFLSALILMQQLTTTGTRGEARRQEYWGHLHCTMVSPSPMNSTAASSNAEHIFIAFILWLLGTAFGMLSLVARQFPRLAVAAAAVARALRNYLIGGL